MSEIKPGIYQHYKGHTYQVIGEATSTEDKKTMVMYHDVNDIKKFWVRPVKMFQEEVEFNGQKTARFIYISETPINDSEQKYLRALADYQNLLKQSAKDKTEFVKYAISDFLQDILPVYDHLKISISNLDSQEMKSPWAVGVSYVLKQFKDVLATHGVEEIKAVGEKFDHNFMEASSGEGEVVTQELQTGYKLNGRVIRPSKVVVSSTLEQDEKSNISKKI